MPPDLDPMTEDAVLACVDLVDRAGANTFQIGYTGDDKNPNWYAHAQYRGARIMCQGQRNPADAANGLAKRIIKGGSCRCGLEVSLSAPSSKTLCRWRRDGQRWVPGCAVPSVEIAPGQRGDLAAMRTAMGGGRG